jgi:hypothetical protein
VPADTDAVLAAALTVAREHGLPVDRPRVVRDLTNLLVHLEPAPVVARVPLTLSRLRPPEWFAEEVALATFLAVGGAPIVPPADEVDPGPHVHDGLVVRFWRYVDHHPSSFDPRAAGKSLRELHAALTGYPRTLPSFDRLDEVGRLLDSMRPSELATAEDIEGLKQACSALRHELVPAGRPIHGDAHFRNILWSASGPLWNDLENACVGPVEYDLACMAWRGLPGTTEALAGYGDHDPGAIARTEPFLALFLAAWTVIVVSRSPTEGARAELRRRIDRATAYAREM